MDFHFLQGCLVIIFSDVSNAVSKAFLVAGLFVWSSHHFPYAACFVLSFIVAAVGLCLPALLPVPLQPA